MTGTIAPNAGSAAPVPSEGAAAKRAQRYECAGVSFALPLDWEDATTFVARGPGAESGSPLILKVARDRIAPTDTLWTHAAQVLVTLGKEIPGFELQEVNNVEVAGRSGMVFRFRLAMEGGTFEQYLALLDPLDDPERRVSVFNISGPEAQSATMRQALGKILQSLQIPGRPPESPPRGSRPPAPLEPAAVAPVPEPDYKVPMPGFRQS